MTDPQSRNDLTSTRGGADRLEIAVALVWRPAAEGPEILVARRPEGAVRGGLWEFPGGKVAPGEAPLSAALRELREETGLVLDADSARPEAIAEALDDDPSQPREASIRLRAYLLEAPAGAEAAPLASEEVRWVSLRMVSSLPSPRANAALVDALARRLAPQ